ncbi:DNA repair protein RadA [Desulfolutivibrio sp.]|uniref:DNA repair protein RadA n=1 Tax=Desulfolutivibrio sp. TaxID=2773296 RepID=UPI002F964613
MKTRQRYVCAECGGISPSWRGQCPRCGKWNTLAAQTVAASSAKSGLASPSSAVPPASLADHPDEGGMAAPTGLADLDRVLGGGLAPGGAILLGGEPGIGKSTLLLQLAGRLAASGRSPVYFSGEESLSQLKSRAARLKCLHPGLLAVSSTDASQAVALLSDPNPPSLLIADSVQTLHSPAAEGASGSVGQVRAVSSELVEAAKRSGTPLILVGHVTKDGQIAGPKLMEHMVDTVLYLEGERRHVFRILRVLKNRFGPTDELLVFEMREKGLAVVADPSTFFLGERDAALSGSAVVMAVEGQRPLAVEVQALAAHSYLGIPRRTALGVDQGRLHLLLAVLEKRLGVHLGQSDIYAKLGGGLSMRDPGLDLGLAAAILSSFHDRPLPAGAVFWGEVDLGGRIRPVSGHDMRLKQAKRLGYGPLFFPRPGKGAQGVSDLAALHAALFS